MLPEQQENIYKLRLQGMGYKAIAAKLLLTVNAVKGYCRRNQLNGTAEDMLLRVKAASNLCLHCKNNISPNTRGRSKKFCCDACRYSWWNENQDKRSTKETALYSYTCGQCGKLCHSYGNKLRKYCSHNCYIVSRFGGEEHGV